MAAPARWWALAPGADPSAPAGPYGDADLAALPEGTSVWREGDAAWQPLADALAAQHQQQPSQQQHVGAGAAHGAHGDPEEPEETSFEDDDGTWYDWDRAERRFKPRVSSAPAPAAAGEQRLRAAEHAQVRPEDMVFEPDEIPAMAGAAAPQGAAGAKRKAQDDPPGGSGDGGKRAQAHASSAIERERERLAAQKVKNADRAGARRAQNTAKGKVTSVYFEGVPDDADEDEIAAHFGKCGVVKPDPESGRPRVKLYRDPTRDGMLKGDGIVTFLKRPSVELALTLLDGTPLRAGGAPLRVSEAVFERPSQGEGEGGAAGGKEGTGGEADGGAGADKPQGTDKRQGALRAPMTKRARQRKRAMMARIEAGKLGWDHADDVALGSEGTVVLRNMFGLEEAYDGGTAFAKELEEDVGAECGKLGAVKKVRVYPKSADCVVTVAFENVDPAQDCVELMHGRYFGGRRVHASIWNGYELFLENSELIEQLEAKRLEDFGRHLDGDGDGDGGDDAGFD